MTELSLEVGRSYINLRGRVVDIVKKIPHKNYCYEDRSGWQYNAKGYSLRNYTGDTNYDGDNLVAVSDVTSYDTPLPGAVVTEPQPISDDGRVVENPTIVIPTYADEVTLEITSRVTPLMININHDGKTSVFTNVTPSEN